MRCFTTIIPFLFFASALYAQQSGQTQPWHGIERTLRYHPEDEDIVIVNGNKRFTRALYGGNTAFRAEAGDLPEFALYMPGMGGNVHFGITAGDSSKWLIDAKHIKAIYRAGSMLYEIKDPLLGNGVIRVAAIAAYSREALLLKLEFVHTPNNIKLVAVYGGATGKKFSRDGDIGADPESSFYLKPAYCKDNVFSLKGNSASLLYGFTAGLSETERYEIQHNGLDTTLPKAEKAKQMSVVFPSSMKLQISDAKDLQTPFAALKSIGKDHPVLLGVSTAPIRSEQYFYIGKTVDQEALAYTDLSAMFDDAEKQRKLIAGRVKIETPDPFINTLGGVLSVAADAIWEAPSYMHGAVAWRMRLNGWRGAYIADVFGWHDRADQHFDGYASSQLTVPPVEGVVMDTALHLARHLEKIGTALFSDGYISRYPDDTTKAHHYDMNLVFIDQLLNHFNWTGDTGYVKKMWPLIQRHLAWEKRNFDIDGDGLYDAYAAIWASDALQYSGGGTTHSSAYNYRANKTAARLAALIGEDGSIYEEEAEKIKAAVNEQLWMKTNGWYAEYKDLLGKQLVHPAPALWSIYHAVDEGIADPFQAYQTLNYVDYQLPHIPIIAKGFPDSTLYTVPTTTWQPYTWSLNNVALAELLHTSLAYWQAGKNEDAYLLWKSSLVESMYLGSSAGNIQQLSFYDAIRGELYRDFADPIGMAGRSLVEGLFGFHPDALHDSLLIAPGFPVAWDHAGISTPDIKFSYKRNENIDTYSIIPSFSKPLYVTLRLPMRKETIAQVRVNDKPVEAEILGDGIGIPYMQIKLPLSTGYIVKISWGGGEVKTGEIKLDAVQKDAINIPLPGKQVLEIYDPQEIVKASVIGKDSIVLGLNIKPGVHYFFSKVKQGSATWWQPISVIGKVSKIDNGLVYTPSAQHQYEPVDLSSIFNDKVKNIFKHNYKSPRPQGPTLQLPTQGIGNWAYWFVSPEINDSVTRVKGHLVTTDGIGFNTPNDTAVNNVCFTSQWDEFPNDVTLSLTGNATAIHLLMAGTTNPMQSRLVNGRVIVWYTDRSSDTLSLENPLNWWPIEQDYYTDGFAFNAGDTRPERLLLKQGIFVKDAPAYYTIKGFSTMAIDGGAASVLHLNLHPGKTLQSLTIEAVANDVIIGLMAATLER